MNAKYSEATHIVWLSGDKRNPTVANKIYIANTFTATKRCESSKEKRCHFY